MIDFKSESGDAFERAVERTSNAWAWWFVLASAAYALSVIGPWIANGAVVVGR